MRGVRVRRTQEERSTQTRLALIEATIATISATGYGGATTALIAERAGVTRGPLLHHFGTRAALMAEVVRHVFEREMHEYEQARRDTGLGLNLHDWPKLLWAVLGKPSGLAVLEILQATSSDAELAAVVVPMQVEVERNALAAMQRAFGGNEESALAVMRLMVWAVRGLSIAEKFLPNRRASDGAIDCLSALLRHAAPGGNLVELADTLDRFSINPTPVID
ncbi:transcriptional regulator [alpha proteobacterium AAP38]|uniref:TetR/AcrR family transcriptional regulator n=1 Tax=Niveispirillum sp. TaxID=1917217 RepID=UPI0006B9B036|nr:transcriptional regulator [alpha proteobacterium AAP38]